VYLWRPLDVTLEAIEIVINVMLPLCTTPCRRMLERIYSSSGGEWSASRLGRFAIGERAPGTHWIGGRVDRRPGLDDVDESDIFLSKLCPNM
jgi:hypothetical protein